MPSTDLVQGRLIRAAQIIQSTACKPLDKPETLEKLRTALTDAIVSFNRLLAIDSTLGAQSIAYTPVCPAAHTQRYPDCVNNAQRSVG